MRLASLKVVKSDILPNYIAPIPTDTTLHSWFDRAGIPKLKCNPSAKRGGGTVYYSVAAIEKLLRSRMTVSTGRSIPAN